MTTYRVVMRNDTPSGVHEAVDPAVPEPMLEDYLTDARTRWQSVTATPNTEDKD